MPTSSIKSRPVYAPLALRRGILHVMVADHDGAGAILALAGGADALFLERSHIYYATDPLLRSRREDHLLGLRPARFEAATSVASLLRRLAERLGTALMGTQLYLAGTEGLIGRATAVALDAGMEPDSIQAEHRGSEARRVQCVHCKAITEDVTTQPCTCARCGLTLFVRDHYSRRIAAFQGVCIDAEEPGSAPAREELFP